MLRYPVYVLSATTNMSQHHIIFVDINKSWIKALQEAKRRECRVSLVFSELYRDSCSEMFEIFHDRVLCNTDDINHLNKAINLLHNESPVCAIITGRDALLIAIAEVCQSLSIPSNSPESLRIVRDKYLLRQHLNKHDQIYYFPLPALNYALVPQEGFSYPMVIKPRSGHLSLFSKKIECRDQLMEAIGYFKKCSEILEERDFWIVENGFICEEFLDGPLISVEIAFCGGVATLICLAIATHQLENECLGYGNIIPYYASSMIQEECFLYCKKICEEVGLSHGVCDIELIWTANGPVVIEINPRRMGGEMTKAFDAATSFSFGNYVIDAYLDVKSQSFLLDKTRRSTLIRKIIVLSPGCITERFFESDIHLEEDEMIVNYGLTASNNVEKLQVLGRILLVGTNIDLLFIRADEILKQIEHLSGIKMVFGHLPRPPEEYREVLMG